MYLGGEVFIVDDVLVDIGALNQEFGSIMPFTTPEYSVSVNATTQNEGTDFVFTITGTNVPPPGIDALYWYGVHGTTEDADFGVNSYDGTTGLPGADNKQYFEINGSAGTFSVVTLIDAETAVAEGDETFTVYVEDGDGRPIDNVTLTITDLVPSYTISTDAPNTTAIAGDTSDEGTTVTFTVDGINVPNAGSAILKWYIDLGASTTNQTNFETTLPTTPATAEEILIVGSTGTFQIQSRVNGEVDLNSNYTIKVINENGIEKINRVQYLTDEVPSLAVSPPGATVIEGNTLEITITSGGYNVGKDIDYAITGAMATDGRIASDDLTGSVTLISDGSGGSTGVAQVPVSSTEDYESPTNGTFTATDNNLNAGFEISSALTFTVSDGPPAYTITGSPAVGQDGGSVTYTVGGQNIPDGSVWFYINDIDTDDGDWVGTPPRNGSRLEIVVSGGTGTASNPTQYATDGDSTDNFYQIFIYDSQTGGTELAEGNRIIAGTTNTVTITPSSVAPEEGDSITVDVTLGGSYQDTGSGGVYKYWITGTNITSSDFQSGYSAESSAVDLTISGGNGTINLTLANDFKTEGSETFVVVVGEETAPGSGVFATIGESADIVVADTSKPTYTLDVPSSVGEDENLNVQVNCIQGTEAEQLYVELTGTGASQYTVQQQDSPGTIAGSFKIFTFITTGDNSVSDADRTITATVRRGSHAGTIVAGPTNITLTDPQQYTLTASDTTPDEGTTVTFNVTGPDGTYYYRPQGFEPVSVDTTQGSTIVSTVYAVQNYTTLATGHTQQTNGINGTINNIGQGSLTMTAPSLQTQLNLLVTFASIANFEYFSGANEPTGSVTISGGTGSFDVDVTTSAVSENKQFIYELHDVDQNVSSTVLASETITIQNVATNGTLAYTALQFVGEDPGVLYDNEAYESTYNAFDGPPYPTAEPRVRFDVDGKIYAKGDQFFEDPDTVPRTPNDFSYVPVGTWISGGTGPYTGYKLSATITTQPLTGGVIVGSYGTPLDIGAFSDGESPNFELEFQLTQFGEVTRFMDVDFQIYEAANPSNTITIDWRLVASCTVDTLGNS